MSCVVTWSVFIFLVGSAFGDFCCVAGLCVEVGYFGFSCISVEVGSLFVGGVLVDVLAWVLFGWLFWHGACVDVVAWVFGRWVRCVVFRCHLVCFFCGVFLSGCVFWWVLVSQVCMGRDICWLWLFIVIQVMMIESCVESFAIEFVV